MSASNPPSSSSNQKRPDRVSNSNTHNEGPFRNPKLSMSLRLFSLRLLSLFKQPVFISLTVFGNLVILASSLALYHIEYGHNPNVHSLLDTLWWAVSTVTTVGYGDVIPVTNPGKVIGITTMIIGTALFWSYTALFAEALLSREIFDLEDELRSIEKNLSRVKMSDVRNQSETKRLIERLEKQVESLKQKIN